MTVTSASSAVAEHSAAAPCRRSWCGRTPTQGTRGCRDVVLRCGGPDGRLRMWHQTGRKQTRTLLEAVSANASVVRSRMCALQGSTAHRPAIYLIRRTLPSRKPPSSARSEAPDVRRWRSRELCCGAGSGEARFVSRSERRFETSRAQRQQREIRPPTGRALIVRRQRTAKAIAPRTGRRTAARGGRSRSPEAEHEDVRGVEGQRHAARGDERPQAAGGAP